MSFRPGGVGTDFTNVLFLHLCVSLLPSEYMGSKLPKGTTKVLCVHFGVRYPCTIYMYKHLYFSCGNVDIYEDVNMEAGGLELGRVKSECNLTHRYLSGLVEDVPNVLKVSSQRLKVHRVSGNIVKLQRQLFFPSTISTCFSFLSLHTDSCRTEAAVEEVL